MKINKILFLFLVIIANTLFASQKEYEEYLNKFRAPIKQSLDDPLSKDVAGIVADYVLQSYGDFKNKKQFDEFFKNKLDKKHRWAVCLIPSQIRNAVKTYDIPYLSKLLSDRFAALDIYLAAKLDNQVGIVAKINNIYPEYAQMFEDYYTNYRANPKREQLFQYACPPDSISSY